jgi:hypothetical protein
MEGPVGQGDTCVTGSGLPRRVPTVGDDMLPQVTGNRDDSCPRT